jgi:vancomycin resistance protein YoaR
VGENEREAEKQAIEEEMQTVSEQTNSRKLTLKKGFVVISSAFILLAGVYGFSRYLRDEKANTSFSALVTAEKPKPTPAFVRLTLDGQTYVLNVRKIGYDGKNVKTIDKRKWRAWLEEVKKRVEQPAQNASMKKLGMPITLEKAGRKMDEKIVQAWLTDIASIMNKSQPIPMISTQPSVVVADLEQVDQKLLGSYRTVFDDRDINRTNNIRLAAAAIHNLVLLPGQEFSFNEVVGERTKARGYKWAKIIVKGEYSEGIGGGICQVSSTLFNSIDRAGLWSTRRYSHSKKVAYVPSGRDATVSWGGPDYRFINNLNKPIVIKIRVSTHSLTAKVYTVPGAKKRLR